MFWRILKRDMTRKKGINLILFLFIILATMFVASSVNSILVVSDATRYCMDKGKVPDMYIAQYATEGKNDLKNWLDGDGKKLINDYSMNESMIISRGNIKSFAGRDGEEFDIQDTIMIQKEWDKHMLIFDLDGNEIEVKDGQIAMQQNEMDQNNLKVGDHITFTIGNITKEFEISKAIMDPAFGGDYVGNTRFVVSDNDYESLRTDVSLRCNNFCIDTEDTVKFMKGFNRQNFTIMINIDGDMFEYAYVMKVIVAAILIILGICLIVISFLILRFTIVFTIQEDYKEIGIMKAIGIKNMGIRKIYMIKYFILTMGAVLIGFALSIPVSDLLLKSVSKSLLLDNGAANIWVNMICSVGVMLLVMLICFLSTNKLRKFSAVEAIRNGETGERYRKRTHYPLSRRKRMSTPLFLAINDILSNIRRYIVLILTFTVGTILIILPVNAVTTLSSDEMAKNFILDLDADFYVSPDSNNKEDNETLNSVDMVSEKVNGLEKDLKSIGYTAKVDTMVFYSASLYTDDPAESTQTVCMQPYNSDGGYMEVLEGKHPVRENELGMTEMLMDDLGVQIGDQIHVRIGQDTYDFVITASYQNYMQMGKNVLINEKFTKMGKSYAGWWFLQCKVDNPPENIMDIVKDKLPQYLVYDAQGVMEESLGSTTSELMSVKYMVLILICIVNILITTLMMKIFILGERGQVAMLRSVGYSNRSLRLWQVLRMGIVLIISEVFGIILSTFLNGILLKPIFAMMGGTHMKIQVNPLESYVIYPALLLIVISLTALFSSAQIKKLNTMEINNIE